MPINNLPGLDVAAGCKTLSSIESLHQVRTAHQLGSHKVFKPRCFEYFNLVRQNEFSFIYHKTPPQMEPETIT